MVYNRIKMTQEGYDKIQEELNQLITVNRREIAQLLKDAVSYGDLSENAEYEVARKLHLELETKIMQLQDKLARAQIVEKVVDTSVVDIGLSVKVKDELNEIVTYHIVGESEGNLDEMKISTASPVGKGLMGHKVGDKVQILVPNGIVEYEILDITVS